MSQILPILFCLVEGLIISTQWIALGQVAHFAPSFLGALGLQYLAAAIAVFALHCLLNRELPQISFRSAQASITLATCCFIVPGVITMWSMLRLPSIVAALAFSSIPLWLWIFGLGKGRLRWVYLAVVIVGTVMVSLGSQHPDYSRTQQHVALFALFFAVFTFALGVALARKVFWIHSAPELNFFALLFSAILLLVLTYIFMGPNKTQVIPPNYFGYITYLGVVVLGIAGYLYRYTSYHLNRIGVLSMTLVIPVGALIWQKLIAPGDFSFNTVSLGGFVITLVGLSVAANSEGYLFWMSFFLANSMRKGDRVACSLEGFMRVEKGTMGKIKILDISIGGLGFRCDSQFRIADSVVVSLPMGDTWTQIALDCRIAHVLKVDSSPYPFLGGLEFQKLPMHTRQNLVEFIARVGNPTH